ncbi:hypothetical protein [Streptomyces virginiae]|uniref:hypothetical protein n=1 Tax=Streptomyces virginiae TaxID=1961 RepID=UPI0036BB1293
MDYHFVLQSAVDRLWSDRRSYAAGLEMLEVFAELDLQLMEAAPQAVSFDEDVRPETFVRVTSVPRLISLLEREGAFAEALALARRLAPFRQGEEVVERLLEKTEALAAESAAGGLV